MTKALKITTTGQLSFVELDDIADYWREVGGFVQAVPVGDRHQMILNEEGKYSGLAHNAVADAVTVIGCTGLAADDFIVGDVLLVGSSPNSENWSDVADSLVESVRKLIAGA
ncbi:DUF3846 domain-containing protein [Micromonospora sp. DT81.3]|uniref:DUF3846 domain-containing protein n=1 Tax=Micromonospora sp. DT81.3 TaxID=3416523 RepID=UPI003CEF73AB